MGVLGKFLLHCDICITCPRPTLSKVMSTDFRYNWAGVKCRPTWHEPVFELPDAVVIPEPLIEGPLVAAVIHHGVVRAGAVGQVTLLEAGLVPAHADEGAAIVAGPHQPLGAAEAHQVEDESQHTEPTARSRQGAHTPRKPILGHPSVLAAS